VVGCGVGVVEGWEWEEGMYLLLKRLELVLLLLAVVLDFFLRFGAGVFYSFCSV